jgi:hypothetical protein
MLAAVSIATHLHDEQTLHEHKKTIKKQNKVIDSLKVYPTYLNVLQVIDQLNTTLSNETKARPRATSRLHFPLMKL